MSINVKGQRFCDGSSCGRLLIKATRVDAGRDYCRACYKREFRAIQCANCSKISRHHRNCLPPFPCLSCLRRTRVCTRCQKPVPGKAGMVLKDGRTVCPSCVPYFREPQACTNCNRLSIRLARLPKYGINTLVCEQCQQRASCRTCTTCKRSRLVAGYLLSGKPHCVACTPGSMQVHQCAKCGVQLPGDGNGLCRECLVREQLRNLAALNAASLQREWARWLLIEYATWLGETRAKQTAIARFFERHVSFFQRLETTFEHRSDITPITLLEQFHVSELRSYLLPMTFLGERLGIHLTKAAKEAHAEAERVQALIIQSRKETWGLLVSDYAVWLAKSGIAQKTCRQLISAAERFCKLRQLTRDRSWTNQDISAHLKNIPGQRANLSKFVSFARTQLGWDVSMPKRSLQVRIPTTVRTLEQLLDQINTLGIKQAPLSLLTRSIAKAFGFRANALTTGVWKVQEQLGAVLLEHDEDSLIVPNQLHQVVLEWGRRQAIA